MACFKTHSTAGLISGCLLSYCASPIINNYIFYPLIIISTCLASILPDIDSDSSKTLRFIFVVINSFIVFLTSLVVIMIWRLDVKSLLKIIFLELIILNLLMFFFKKITKHRGMFHSIPATIIISLAAFLLLSKITNNFNVILLLSLSVALGYLSHLVLDVLYSPVSLFKEKIIVPKILGSPLKLFSKYWIINIFVYSFIFVETYLLTAIWTF